MHLRSSLDLRLPLSMALGYGLHHTLLINPRHYQVNQRYGEEDQLPVELQIHQLRLVATLTVIFSWKKGSG